SGSRCGQSCYEIAGKKPLHSMQGAQTDWGRTADGKRPIVRIEMVPNTYISLAQELPEVRQQMNGVRQLIEHAMAARLLTLFFGYDWYQQKIAFRDDPDEWMHNQKGDTGTNRIP